MHHILAEMHTYNVCIYIYIKEEKEKRREEKRREEKRREEKRREEKRRREEKKKTHTQGKCAMVLLCVSSVPASCVHIWFVSCPCFMSLWVNLCPAVCMWLCVNYPVYLVPVFWGLGVGGIGPCCPAASFPGTPVVAWHGLEIKLRYVVATAGSEATPIIIKYLLIYNWILLWLILLLLLALFIVLHPFPILIKLILLLWLLLIYCC